MKPGQWFVYPIDQPLPDAIRVYEGSWKRRQHVATITKMQALAFIRWHGDPCVYYSVSAPNDKRIDVRCVGDNSAWFEGDDE